MKIERCKKCGAKIVFLKTSKASYMPVDWDSLQPIDQRNFTNGFPIQYDPKRGHVSHFATCPYSDEFRNKRNGGKKNEKN